MATVSFNLQLMFVGPSSGLSSRNIRNSIQLFFKRNLSARIRCMAQVSTKFGDLLVFSGPTPKRINGRLKMVGFVAAIAVELSKGESMLAQISVGGIGWFLGTTTLLTLASTVPLFKDTMAESKSKGFMTSDAELWNGRFAMLGLVALAFTEYITGGTLI